MFKLKYFYFLMIAGVCVLFSAYTVTSVQQSASTEIKLDSTVIATKTIASGLNVAWELCWGPDNWIWFTEQSGTISKMNPNTGEKKLLLSIPEVYRYRSLGLLGMAIHPDKKQPYVFVDYTYKDGKSLLSKLVRYEYTSDSLINPLIILKDIPGSTGHNGSRVAVSPDGKVMLATGYGAKKGDAQDLKSLNGKVLRLNIDGSIPEDNPIPGSPVFSSGHRNPQGMVYHPVNGLLYSSEHGDAIEDEINIIKRLGNYGWPQVEGFNDNAEERTYFNAHAIIEPLKAWTPVIAPAGIDFYHSQTIPEWNNSVLLVTLKTQTLRVLKLNNEGDEVKSEKVYLDHAFGRLRDICVSPEGDVYVSTSNRDWNPGEGYPKADDDKIIKIYKVRTEKNKQPLAVKTPLKAPLKKGPVSSTPAKKIATGTSATKVDVAAGAVLYTNYCASCHKKDGTGVAGIFPPLKGASQVTGDKNYLIQILLKGLSGPIKVNGQTYDQEMPSFKFLSDSDIVKITNYIRNSFGNRASAVTLQEVSKKRANP